MLYLYFTPSSSQGSFEFFTYPNRTPTLPTRHLFLPRNALLREKEQNEEDGRQEQMKDADLTNVFLMLEIFYLIKSLENNLSSILIIYNYFILKEQ